ncbi:MAG: hypothetical protein RI894_1275 [Bacteroidota bacterium]|jgi:hypothetical protein
MSDYIQPQQEEEKNKRSLLPIILGVLLLGTVALNVYLLWDKSQKVETIHTLDKAVAKSDSLNKALDAQYQEAVKELDGQKTSNAELTAKIEGQKADLERKRNEIARMIKSSGGNKQALAAVEARLTEMKTQSDGFMAEIAKLKEENTKLTADVGSLTTKNEEHVKTIADRESTIKTKDDEATKLQEEKKALSEKVEIGSVLKVNNMKATPMWTRHSKDDVVSIAKNCEKVKVEFDVIENLVTKPGENYFLCKVTNPRGETLFVESSGSGQFKDKNGADTRFTMFKAFNYSNDAPHISLEWKDKKFEPGNYNVEIYNKGYSVGKTTFTLKKGLF